MRLLTLAFLIAAAALGATAEEKRERVRANEPTVVTVRGQADAVPRRSAPRKVGHAFRTGAGSLFRGSVGFIGWLLNPGDDVQGAGKRSAAPAR